LSGGLDKFLAWVYNIMFGNGEVLWTSLVGSRGQNIFSQSKFKKAGKEMNFLASAF